MSNISLRLIDSIDIIEGRVSVAIAQHMNKVLSTKKGFLKDEIKKRLRLWIASQPEIMSLKSNNLAAELGLPAGSVNATVEAIILSVQNSTDVLFERFNSKLKGGVSMRFQPSHFANLLGLSQGHVKLPESGDLHWLQWLLERGNDMIVVNYHFVPSGRGRSRGGVMGKGGAWRVPPQFAGTSEDNFITRAFEGREKEIEELFTRTIGR